MTIIPTWRCVQSGMVELLVVHALQYVNLAQSRPRLSISPDCGPCSDPMRVKYSGSAMINGSLPATLRHVADIISLRTINITISPDNDAERHTQ